MGIRPVEPSQHGRQVYAGGARGVVRQAQL